MAHSLVPPSVSLPTSTPKRSTHLLPGADRQRRPLYTKRSILYGLSTIGIVSLVAPDSATAAKRRQVAAPPPEEKKDPNLSGLQAKLLASKKRKEAMKETVTKLRDNGKTSQ